MNIINNATAHYRTRLENMPRIEVPEWGDETGPAIIYAKPLTPATNARILRINREEGLDYATAEALIVRVVDEHGEPLFNSKNRTELVEMVDSDVVDRVLSKMSPADESAVEDAEKNS